MASKHPARLVDDPPSASPPRVHDEEEEEEEEMEVVEEPQLEKSDMERSEKEEEDEEEMSETDDETTKSLPHTPQATKLSKTLKNHSLDESFEDEAEVSEADDDMAKSSPRNTTQITKLSQTSKDKSIDESSEEEGEGSDTDDDTTKNSPTASSFIVKPVVNMNNQSTGTKQPTTKRALNDVGREKDLPNKKTKVAKDHHSKESREGSAKKAGRVWSEDDEISILRGIIDFQKKKGKDVHSDMGAFLEFVKGRFTFEVTRTQLYEKVRRLKGKFIANVNAGKGENFFPKAHDLECFKLSKKIWGGDKSGSEDDSDRDVNAASVYCDGVAHTENVNIDKEKKGRSDKKNKKKTKKTKMVDAPKIVEEPAEPVTKEDEDVSQDKKNAAMDDEKIVNNDENNNITLKYPNLVASLSMYTESQRNLMMQGICLVDSEKARELEDCWNELCIKETELHCRKMELLAAQSRLVLDAWKQKW